MCFLRCMSFFCCCCSRPKPVFTSLPLIDDSDSEEDVLKDTPLECQNRIKPIVKGLIAEATQQGRSSKSHADLTLGTLFLQLNQSNISDSETSYRIQITCLNKTYTGTSKVNFIAAYNALFSAKNTYNILEVWEDKDPYSLHTTASRM